jgi:hypothetical protein
MAGGASGLLDAGGSDQKTGTSRIVANATAKENNPTLATRIAITGGSFR